MTATIVSLLVSLLIGGLGVLLVAKILPGFHLRGGLVSAIIVAALYGVLKALLQWVLIVVTLPAVLVTAGLFIFLINAFLLWLTDKALKRLEIDSVWSLLLGTVLLSVFDWLMSWFFNTSDFFSVIAS